MPEEAGNVLRCCDCKKIMTKKKLLTLGECPYCGCHRVRGTNPTYWEVFKLRIGILK